MCALSRTRTYNNGSEDRCDIHFTMRAEVKETYKFGVRVGRIELPSHPWQGRVLPLNHTRNKSNITYYFDFTNTFLC